MKDRQPMFGDIVDLTNEKNPWGNLSSVGEVVGPVVDGRAQVEWVWGDGEITTGKLYVDTLSVLRKGTDDDRVRLASQKTLQAYVKELYTEIA